MYRVEIIIEPKRGEIRDNELVYEWFNADNEEEAEEMVKTYTEILTKAKDDDKTYKYGTIRSGEEVIDELQRKIGRIRRGEVMPHEKEDLKNSLKEVNKELEKLGRRTIKTTL